MRPDLGLPHEPSDAPVQTLDPTTRKLELPGGRKATIAEFVEDAETLEMLKQFGVDMVQGYHLDMPRATHPALAGLVA